jgi:hypothetical protein
MNFIISSLLNFSFRMRFHEQAQSTEPATFSIMPFWTFFRDSYFLYFNDILIKCWSSQLTSHITSAMLSNSNFVRYLNKRSLILSIWALIGLGFTIWFFIAYDRLNSNHSTPHEVLKITKTGSDISISSILGFFFTNSQS